MKSEMTRRDIEALFVSDPNNITYLTRYTTPLGYVPQGLLILLKHEEPTSILRLMDAPAAIHQTFLARDRIIGYPEELIANAERDGCDLVIDFLGDAGVASCGIAVELGNLSAKTAEKFRKRLPRAHIADFTNAVTRIRIVKSDLEIAVMPEAAAIQMPQWRVPPK
ncbi:Xaa-Pro aminopeptidase [Bradyrhizobium sp. USDA 3686]|uniref:aminopeptidase P family N-terminal domain-containing protein n=1 Tax=Bradyrhizobium canariense TaxID=255045 RepID=UPI002897C24C|nr:aminopeptidase P family N-terminal domain-containing protein [Bradyrhizobium canariense]MBM7487852.1 Xaa-Pro aminopeptidase [Bradyrhizobium canariense]